MSGSYPRLYWR